MPERRLSVHRAGSGSPIAQFEVPLNADDKVELAEVDGEVVLLISNPRHVTAGVVEGEAALEMSTGAPGVAKIHSQQGLHGFLGGADDKVEKAKKSGTLSAKSLARQLAGTAEEPDTSGEPSGADTTGGTPGGTMPSIAGSDSPESPVPGGELTKDAEKASKGRAKAAASK